MLLSTCRCLTSPLFVDGCACPDPSIRRWLPHWSTVPWETICSLGPPGHSLPIGQFLDPVLGSPLPAHRLPLRPYVSLLAPRQEWPARVGWPSRCSCHWRWVHMTEFGRQNSLGALRQLLRRSNPPNGRYVSASFLLLRSSFLAVR